MADILHNPLETPNKPELVIDLHDGSSDKVSIVIVHYNRPDYLNICLQSIQVMSNLNNYEVIVVDNGSDQESIAFLKILEDEGIKVIYNKENLYWSDAANLGAKAASEDSKYLIFMHDDTVVLNHSWIDILINISVGRKSGIVGNEQGNYYIPTWKQNIPFVKDWCIMFTKECWEDVGPWPTELPFIGHSFILSCKATKKGYNPVVNGNVLVHHYRSPIIEHNLFTKLGQEAMSVIGKMLPMIMG